MQGGGRNVKIYLAHPFGLRGFMRKWELEIESKYPVEIVNPFFDLPERHDYIEIVEKDLEALDGCDIVLAVVSERSVGTKMEIFHARRSGKIVVAYFIDPELRSDPWIQYCVTFAAYTLNEAEEFLRGLLRRG
ncbi:MAG: hypothetical protein QW334_00220 [Thermofilum sp.]